MTTFAEPTGVNHGPTESPDTQPARQHPSWSDVSHHGAMVLVWVIWVLLVTPAAGGRDVTPLLLGLGFLLVAATVLRPWQHAPRATILLPAAAAAGSVLVLSVTPLGWSHSAEVAWTLSGTLVLPLVVAYARTPGRQIAVALSILAAGMAQFAQALVPWWGGQDPNALMWGTFYWHNQFGAYVLAAAVLGYALFLRGPRVTVVPGIIVGAVCSAGVLFSTSRTCLGLLVLGWLLLAPGRTTWTRREFGRWLFVPAASALTSAALSGPWFFPKHSFHWLFLGGGSGASGGRGLDTLGSNGGARWIFTKAALQGWAGSPFAGNGFGSFRYTEVSHVPVGYTISPYVHNGPADWLTSGGLLFALPLLVGLVLLARGWLPGLVRRPDSSTGAVRQGCAVGLLILTVHSCLDFDWTYPSLSILYGVFAGLFLAMGTGLTAAPPIATRAGWRSWAPALALALTFAVTAATVLGDGATRRPGRIAATTPTTVVTTLVFKTDAWPADPELASTALDLALPALSGRSRQLQVDRATAERLLIATSTIAKVDPQTALKRAAVEVGLGQRSFGRQTGERLVSREGKTRPYLYVELAQLQAMAGEDPAALGSLATARADVPPGPGADASPLGREITAMTRWFAASEG